MLDVWAESRLQVVSNHRTLLDESRKFLFGKVVLMQLQQ